ncbi:MAG: hypothetical protein IIB41_07690 [Candidatus Marinimicrobia bacterium]|nr:hypothetical protein [Candidatus Neomarinimicrobiota bacterium]
MRETSAKFNPTRADDEFRLKILELEITEKQNEEERALQSDFHRRNMLDSGPYIDALIKLSIEQLKERIQLRIEADFEAIHSGDHIEREVESTLKARINIYVGNQGEQVKQKVDMQMKRFPLPANVSPKVNFLISQEIVGLMQFAQLKISHLVIKHNKNFAISSHESTTTNQSSPDSKSKQRIAQRDYLRLIRSLSYTQKKVVKRLKESGSVKHADLFAKIVPGEGYTHLREVFMNSKNGRRFYNEEMDRSGGVWSLKREDLIPKKFKFS